MAKCQWCEREMMTADSCTETEVTYPDGTKLPAIPYKTDDPDHRCHDCGIKAGGIHHPGCDMERCPRCGGQLISCGCLSEPEKEEEKE